MVEVENEEGEEKLKEESQERVVVNQDDEEGEVVAEDAADADDKYIFTLINKNIFIMIHVLASVNEPHKLTGNLGDRFGYVLMEFYCKKMNIEVKRVGVYDDIGKNTFAIVGSIYYLCIHKLHEAQWKMNKKYGKEMPDISNNIIVIGCGKIKEFTKEDSFFVENKRWYKNLICLKILNFGY